MSQVRDRNTLTSTTVIVVVVVEVKTPIVLPISYLNLSWRMKFK